MDEKYEQYKKSSQYKKYKLINIFLGVLLVAIIVFCYVFYKMATKEEVYYDENKHYSYEIKNNVVYLNSEIGLEQSYKCKKNCEIYTTGSGLTYFDKGRILLKEEEIVFLYDLIGSKKLSGNYNRIDFIMDGKGTELENIKMFKINDTFDKQGVMDLNGELLIDLIYDTVGRTVDNNLLSYSYDKNYITAKSGEKWGLISLNKGKKLIELKYEDIKLSDYNKLTVKESGLWYLIDEKNNQIIPKGYSSMDVYENYLVVSENNKAFVLDLLGNVMSNKIDLYYDVDPWAVITEHGLQTKLENNKIYLMVDRPKDINAGTYETIKFYYDEQAKQLISSY